MNRTKKIKASASAMRTFYSEDYCGTFFKAKHIDHELIPPSDVMIRGLYFEQGIIGTAGKEQVEIEKLKSGAPSKAETDLLELIDFANEVIASRDIKILETQVFLETDTSRGIVDFYAEIDGRKCMVDLKYTETAADDRWRGWGAPQEKADAKSQALQYIYMHHELHGEFLPFYFLVFGKSKWVKLVKVVVDEQTYDDRINSIYAYLDAVNEVAAQGFPAVPEFNKCLKCPLYATCKDRSTAPETIEVYI